MLCFDPFQPELLDLQKADADLPKMHHFRTKGGPHMSPKLTPTICKTWLPKLYQDANKVVWIKLDKYKYPRTALFLQNGAL